MSNKLATILAATALSIQLAGAPAMAAPPGPGDCKTGASVTGSLEIQSNVITGAVGCSGEAIVPNYVTSIGPSAFDGFTGVTSISFEAGSNLTSIEMGAFAESGITSIEIPAGVTFIGSRAFDNAQNLGAVTFASGSAITQITNRAFASASLTSIRIPPSVRVIGDHAFQDSSRLASITFDSGSSLQTIGTEAFAKTGLTSIDIPASVTSIGVNAFWDTSSMTTIRFAAGSALTSIGNSAFTYSGITSIEIPGSVTTLGTYVFERTDDLLTASFAAGSSLTSVPEGLFHYSNVGSVTLPASLTSIGASAFYNNPNLGSITIPSGVNSIGANAFGSSPTLTTIRFEGLTAPTIGANAFASLRAGATASIKYNATGFDTVGGFWNSLTVTRDAAPAPASTPLPVIPPVQTPAPPVSTSFSLDSPNLATPQKKALRELIAEVGKEGSFEVVARVVRTPGMSKAEARALALAKAKEIKRYLVSKGVKKKDIAVVTRIAPEGSKAKTKVSGVAD